MKRSLLLSCAIVLASARPALAWDPFSDDFFDPGPEPPPPDPAPYVVPEGIYLVTDVYGGDVVSTSGDTTTYTTTTEHETPGTYARVVDVVGTGSGSAFDGSSFNGRESLPDGRSVAGTYYEDFVLTAGGFVSVNIVFFQDDSATRVTSGPPAAQPTAAPTPAPTAAPAPTPVAVPIAVAQPSSATPRPGATPEEGPTPPPAPRTATAAVALSPVGAPLASIEVLRGRLVHLWPRVFIGGRPGSVRSWRLVSGSVDVVTRRDGGGADACDAIWLTLPPPGTVFALRFEVTSDELPGRTLAAALNVAVRSPALGQ